MRTTLCITVVLAAALAGCGGPRPGSDDAAVRDRGEHVEVKYEIAVIPKGLAHQFWLSVKAGAEAAGQRHGARVIWQGPARETETAKQISIVEDMISRGVDAIVMAACDENALVDVVEQASEAGIPVVMIDSGVKSDAPVSFVATDNPRGARAAAEELARLIDEEGQVGVLPFIPGAATSEQREKGFKDRIAGYPGIEVVATLYTQGEVDRAMAVTEDMMTANPELKGVFAANEGGALGAAQALEVAGKAGEIKLVAFDAAEEQVEALKRGTIQALIVQNPYQMGFQGVKTAVDHLEGRPVRGRVDTGVAVVRADNLDDPAVQELLNPAASTE